MPSWTVEGRPPSGSPLKRRASNGEVNPSELISSLKNELSRSRAETQKVSDQLTCLVTLIKRAWTGEKRAITHLSNIVGLDPPDFLDGTKGRPASRMNKKEQRAEKNWERLTIRLLEHYYQQLQMEIEARQQMYMASRQLYMDEILSNHHKDMSRFALHRKNLRLEDVDQRFVKTYHKNKQFRKGPTLQRAHSAEAHRPRQVNVCDIVEQTDKTLRELMALTGDPAGQKLASRTNSSNHDQYFHQRGRADYDDSNRYTQANLFDVDGAFCPEAFGKRSRPISAAILREHDTNRARPRSAVFVTQRGERPLKYETTRPIEIKKLNLGGKKDEHTSRSSVISTENLSNTGRISEQIDGEESSEEELMKEKEVDLITPPLRIRVNSAINRPESISKLSDDLQKMESMEKEFRKTTLALQKKLGISEDGIV